MLRNIRYEKGWNSFPSLVVLILMESNITICLNPGCFYLPVFGYCVVCEDDVGGDESSTTGWPIVDPAGSRVFAGDHDLHLGGGGKRCMMKERMHTDR